MSNAPVIPRPGWTLGLDGRWQPSHRDPAERAKRNALILHLRAQSMSEQAIADIVGCSQTTVHKVVARARAAEKAA